ncbi:3-oxoacyl-(Acyl-carrier-protein) synthase [Desulfosarcina cetonica]|nr:3-oxoacyl-(Acyl-carrier-protein) synthase [Desulfosarcina cetonica]
MVAVAVDACGMVSSVGLSAPAACAAVRCGLTNVSETRFMDGTGNWIMAAQVPLEEPWRGRTKLLKMAAGAIRECILDLKPTDLAHTALLLCVAERERPGRTAGIDNLLLAEVQEDLGVQFHSSSTLIAEGKVGGASAIQTAIDLLTRAGMRYCIVAGTDSYLTAGTLSGLEENQRLLTDSNSDGFIPGEAAAAVRLALKANAPTAPVTITGIGFGSEKATIVSEEPLRADGMVAAIKSALAMAGCDMGALDFRICDLSGEQYGFKEAALALTRLLRVRKEEFDIWHPAECIGETGAAIVPVVLCVAAAALKKGYAKGNGILCHFANDASQRAAIIVNRS